MIVLICVSIISFCSGMLIGMFVNETYHVKKGDAYK